MKRRTSNTQILDRVDRLCYRVDALLQVVGGMVGSLGAHGGAPMPPRPVDPNVQELLRAMREGPGLGESRYPREELSPQEKARQIQKAREQAEKLKEKLNQEIDATLDARAKRGVPDDGNAITPQDSLDLDAVR